MANNLLHLKETQFFTSLLTDNNSQRNETYWRLRKFQSIKISLFSYWRLKKARGPKKTFAESIINHFCFPTSHVKKICLDLQHNWKTFFRIKFFITLWNFSFCHISLHHFALVWKMFSYSLITQPWAKHLKYFKIYAYIILRKNNNFETSAHFFEYFKLQLDIETAKKWKWKKNKVRVSTINGQRWIYFLSKAMFLFVRSLQSWNLSVTKDSNLKLLRHVSKF